MALFSLLDAWLLAVLYETKKPQLWLWLSKYGARSWTRTNDPLINSQVLEPAELFGRGGSVLCEFSLRKFSSGSTWCVVDQGAAYPAAVADHDLARCHAAAAQVQGEIGARAAAIRQEADVTPALA